MRFLILSIFLTISFISKAEISITTLVSCICEGQGTQPFEVIANGSAEPFSFAWTGPNGYTSDNQTPDDITEAGQYQVEITNLYGCTLFFMETLDACPNSFQSIDLEIIPDCGGGGGNILTTVMGGAPGFLNYQWARAGELLENLTIPNIYNVAPGIYSVTVTDSQGCTIVGEGEVLDQSDIPPFVISPEITPACTPNEGQIQLNITDVQQPLDIQWSTGDEGHELLNINSGVYRVTVTDGNNCSVIEEFYVPAGPVVTAEIVPATCASESDGSISLTITGSTSNTIEWSDDPDDMYLNETVRENLTAGSYGVTITSPDGCVFEDTYNVAPTESSDYYPYLKRVRILASGPGVSETIYDGQWLPTSDDCVIYEGGTQNLNTDLLSAMEAGDIVWNVVAEFSEPIGSGGYDFTSSIGGLFNGFFGPSTSNNIITSAIVQTLVSSDGFSLSMSFNAMDLEFNPILDMFNTSNQLSDCVTIPAIDIATCEWSPPVDMVNNDETHQLEFECITVELIATDNGFCVDLGTTPITAIEGIRWKEPNGAWGFTNTDNNLCYDITHNLYDDYCVRVRATNGCLVQMCATYCSPPPFNEISLEVSNPQCPGSSDGAVCVSANSTEMLTFDWGNGNTDACLENLTAGTYCVTVSSATCDLVPGLPLIRCENLEDNSEPLGFTSNLSTTCEGTTMGVACINPQGGQAPYTINWMSGETGNCIDNLAVGCHEFSIIDACGTILEDCVEIFLMDVGEINVMILEQEPNPCQSSLELNISSTFAVRIDINHSSIPGIAFIEYGIGYFMFSDIPSGLYEIIITDICGQETVLTADVVPEETIPPGVTNINIGRSCLDINTGYITFDVSEGQGPFSFHLYNTNTSLMSEEASFTDLEPGTYFLDVTDKCNGTWEGAAEFEIEEWEQIEPIYEITNACNGQNNGAIDLMSFDDGGVTQTLSHLWSNGETTRDIIDLSPGNYSLTVTGDVTGCSASYEYTVGVIESFEIETVIIEGESFVFEDEEEEPVLQQDGSITITPDDSNYSYLWSNGDTGPNIDNLSTGDYSLTITNNEGTPICNSVFNFNVPLCNGLLQAPAIDYHNTTVTPIVDGNPGSIDLAVTEGSFNTQFLWRRIFSNAEPVISQQEDLDNITETGTYCVTILNPCSPDIVECFRILEGCTDTDAHFDLTVQNNCMDEESGPSALIFEGIEGAFPTAPIGDKLILEWSTGETGVVAVECGFFTECDVLYVVEGSQSIDIIMLPHGTQATELNEVEWGSTRTFSVDVFDFDTGCFLGSAGAEFSNNDVDNFVLSRTCYPVSALSDDFAEFDESYFTDFAGCKTCGFEFDDNEIVGYNCKEYTPLNVRFIPNDEDDPFAQNECQKGGRIVYGEGDEVVEIAVIYSNQTSIFFDDGDGGNCGCLFPAEELNYSLSNIILPTCHNQGVFFYAETESCINDPVDPVDPDSFIEFVENTTCADFPDCIDCRVEIEFAEMACATYAAFCYDDGERVRLTENAATPSYECQCKRCGTAAAPKFYELTYCAILEENNVCSSIPISNQVTATSSLPFCDDYICDCLPGSSCDDLEINGLQTSNDDSSPTYNISPNPSNGIFNFATHLPELMDIELNITDAIGNKITKIELTDRIGHLSFNFEFDDSIRSGIFFVTISNSKGDVQIKRIMLIK